MNQAVGGVPDTEEEHLAAHLRQAVNRAADAERADREMVARQFHGLRPDDGNGVRRVQAAHCAGAFASRLGDGPRAGRRGRGVEIRLRHRRRVIERRQHQVAPRADRLQEGFNDRFRAAFHVAHAAQRTVDDQAVAFRQAEFPQAGGKLCARDGHRRLAHVPFSNHALTAWCTTRQPVHASSTGTASSG